MGVGSLRSPWEYDGRLPPDVDYYLNLVLPRKEGPGKKIGSQVRLFHGRILQIEWSNYMQPIPRLLVNLPVISVKTPVNLLVEPTKLRFMGAIGARVRGIHSGEARTAWSGEEPCNWACHGPWANPQWWDDHQATYETTYETNETNMGLLLGILLGILPDLLGFTRIWVILFGKTIGNIS